MKCKQGNLACANYILGPTCCTESNRPMLSNTKVVKRGGSHFCTIGTQVPNRAMVGKDTENSHTCRLVKNSDARGGEMQLMQRSEDWRTGIQVGERN